LYGVMASNSADNRRFAFLQDASGIQSGFHNDAFTLYRGWLTVIGGYAAGIDKIQLMGRVTVSPHGSERDAGFMDIPPVVRNASFTFARPDRGTMQIKDDANAYTWTLPNRTTMPPGTQPLGWSVEVRNANSLGSITIARQANVILRKPGSGTDANVTLSPWGDAIITLEKDDGTNYHYVIRGTGI
ncbi:MAG: hypothetical protein ACRDAM_20400, partial [Casimicrobium sp.]